ncbi:hypothetical protein HY025_05530 [Candidatus Daviesbacteria bacterium]|nr:hypothetical protein [Candidatus Daviesbacteria bacterium]
MFLSKFKKQLAVFLKNQQGAIPLLVLVAVLGLVAFLAISSTFSFRNSIFSRLFPKPPSHAASKNGPVQSIYTPDNYGVNYFGFSSDDTIRGQQLDLIKQTGAKWVRGVTCQWQSIQWDQNMYSSNLWNFAACDKIVNEIVSRGMTPLMALWYSSNSCTTAPSNPITQISGYPPCDNQKFHDYVYRVVSRYGSNANGIVPDKNDTAAYGQNKVHFYELGNEPNRQNAFPIADGLGGTYDATNEPAHLAANTYVSLLNTAHDAIKGSSGADAGSNLVVASINAGNVIVPRTDFLTDVIKGAGNNIDIMNLHVYGDQKSFDTSLSQAKQAYVDAGIAEKPYWVTENGYASDSTFKSFPFPSTEPDFYCPTGTCYQQQANYINEMIPYMFNSGVSKVFWFASVDDPQSTSPGYCTDSLMYYPGYQCNQNGPAPSSVPLTQKDPGFTAYKNLVAKPDPLPPITSMVSPVDGSSISGALTISATATDNVGVTKVEFYVDGGDNKGGTGPYKTMTAPTSGSTYSNDQNTFTLVQGSTHTLYVKAYDAAGNFAQSNTISFKVTDTTAPAVSITYPASSTPPLSGGTTITATATDNIAIAHVDFYIDGALLSSDKNPDSGTNNYSAFWGSGTLPQGSIHTIYAIAYDTAATPNQTTSQTITVTTNDSSKPVVSNIVPTNLATINSGIIAVSATATDNVGVTKVEFWQDSDSAPFATDTSAPYSASWDATNLSQGVQHTLTVKAYDAQGNIGSGTSKVTFIDTTKPVISNLLPVNGTVVTLNVTVNLQATATDNVKIKNVTFSVDGTQKCSVGYSSAVNDVYTCSNWKPTLKSHTYNISVTANDTASSTNSTTSTYTLKTL